MQADVAQLVEHVHGKDGVASSILAIGSRIKYHYQLAKLSYGLFFDNYPDCSFCGDMGHSL